MNGVKVKKEKIVVGDGDNISLGQIVGNKDVDSEFRKSFSYPVNHMRTLQLTILSFSPSFARDQAGVSNLNMQNPKEVNVKIHKKQVVYS